jgi:phage shock protein PspC (stress-responsive transcriptional regulator)
MAKPKSTKKKSSRKSSKPTPKSKIDIDTQIEHFGEEVGRIGERVGRRMEEKGEQWDSWFHRTFGLVGPVISSIFGIIVLGLALWVLILVNLPIGSGFISSLEGFFRSNLGLFFLIFLFFSYSSYFSKASPKGYRPFSPFVTAVGIVIAFWFLAEAVAIANMSLGILFLTQASSWILANLVLIFGFVLVLGYVVFSVMIAFGNPTESAPKSEARREPPSTRNKTSPQRLYRSGDDKVLGGVCGGIAEYLGVDPVLIRLLWVIFTLAWGAGVIGYIIAWIIIPRNPKHKWDD